MKLSVSCSNTASAHRPGRLQHEDSSVPRTVPGGSCSRRNALAGALALALPFSAQAQSPPADEATRLDAVVVTGVRASIQKSLVDKRNAIGIVDAISAEDMGKFPDVNLSESLQRISGITLDRNANGEGNVINLRGLGPEFTRVEINGMSGMSNGTESRAEGSGGSRAFNFEMFASELFSKATVYKTGLAEVDEGGLAGTVRLETPRPLDSQGTRIAGSVLGNYSELGSHLDSRAAVLFSHNQHDVFGIAASVAWSKTHFVSNTVEASSWLPFGPYNNPTVESPNRIRASDEVRAALVPRGPLYFAFDEDRDTIGSTLTLQFRPNERVNVTLDGLYGTLNSKRMVVRPDMTISTGANAPTNVEIKDGVLVSGDFTGVQQRIGARFHTTDEDYQQLVVRMEWTPDEYWSIRPLLGYAKRESYRTWDLLSFRLAENGVFDPGTVSYRLRGDYIDFGSTHTNFDANPEDWLFNVFFVRPSRDQDREKQARVDFDRHFAGNDHVLKFGLRYNDRSKDRVATQWRLQRESGTSPADIPGLDSAWRYFDFKLSGSTAPRRMMTVDHGRVWDVFLPGGNPVAGTYVNDMSGFGAQETWSLQEKTGSGWAQMDMLFGAWTLIPGIRYVRTEQITDGFNVISANTPAEVITPVHFTKTYNGWLPSFSARYEVSDQVVLRAAWARTLSRPNLANLAPSETISGTRNGTGTRGNPELDPYYAHNIDVGAEWYFSSEGLLAANLFYKKANNFIDTRTFVEERTFPEQATGILITSPLTFREPFNGVTASIKGFELSAQSRFSWLPGAWGNFGGILNYSHTESSADFSVAGDVRSQGLPGLSKNSLNAVLYYDDGKFDARLAYAWRDRYLSEFADAGGVPRFTKDYGQLDLSLNYQVSPHLWLQTQVLNLTREQRIEQSSIRYLPYGIADIDRRFMFGIRMAF